MLAIPQWPVVPERDMQKMDRVKIALRHVDSRGMEHRVRGCRCCSSAMIFQFIVTRAPPWVSVPSLYQLIKTISQPSAFPPALLERLAECLAVKMTDVHSTTRRIVCFHNQKLDEMRCKLDSTENPLSLEKRRNTKPHIESDIIGTTNEPRC